MKTAALLSLLLSLTPSARASGAGADPFNFLFLDANARPVAMGGAYTALAADSNSLLYNPAGLGAMHGHEATFMHDQHFLDVAQEYGAYASPKGWGVSVNSLSFGPTTKTTYSNPGGTGLGAVGLSDLAVSAGYGRDLFEVMRLGASFKYIRESVAGVSASGYAMDLGVQHDAAFLRGLSFGAALQNLGPSVRFQRASENLPLNLRLGTAFRFQALGQANSASFDITKERSESPLFGAGLETVLGGMLPLRIGFNTRNQAGVGVTFGLGWSHPNFGIDYAFVPYGELGSAHRVSLSVRWGNAEAEEKLSEASFRKEVKARDTPAARFAAADRAAASGEWAQGRRELAAARRMLSQEDRRLVIYFTKSGELEFEAGNLDEAQSLFIEGIHTARRLGTAGPAVAGAYIGLAKCLAAEGNQKAADEALKKALEVDPSERQKDEIRTALGKSKK